MSDHQDTISAIEKQGERFERGIEKIASQTSEVILAVNQLATAIKVGMGRPVNGSNWQMFAVMVTLLLAGMGMLYQGQAQNTRAVEAHASLPSHREAAAEVAVLQGHVARLDTHMQALDVSLQREMGLINQTTSEKINSTAEIHRATVGQLNDRVQRLEKAIGVVPLTERIDRLEVTRE